MDISLDDLLIYLVLLGALGNALAALPWGGAKRLGEGLAAFGLDIRKAVVAARPSLQTSAEKRTEAAGKDPDSP